MLCATFAVLTCATAVSAADLPADKGRYVAVRTILAPQAGQAAGIDDKFVYAISSMAVVKFDRESGKELATSIGEAHHLNSGFAWKGKLYCAHSNFPKKPDESDVRVLDPETMKLTVFHEFPNPPGSLTWVVRKGEDWWCHFAQYGKANANSVLIRFDSDWKELGRWTYPPELVAQWGDYSLSGGLWRGDELLATGHDKRFIYRLRVPKDGKVVEVIAAIASPFPGQGIAADPKSDQLVGIDRAKKAILFARYEKSE